MSVATSYQLSKTYDASNFFNEFAFFNQPDPTHGNVYYLDHDTAVGTGLSYINNEGNIVMKVDDSSFVPFGQQRNSVRVSSKDSFGFGTLWVLDAHHVPYGCSVWPAYWSLGANVAWPYGGEIDIFEGVNFQDFNQMTLHTAPGCYMPDRISQTGTALGKDCGSTPGHNDGCGVMESNPSTYGKAFSDAGGGVWITEVDTTGIRVWFVPRSSVPAGGVPPDPSRLGTPSAFFPPSQCDMSTYFTPQEIVFDITLCGDWAGNAMGGACPVAGGESCYSTYVVGDGHNFNRAYFEIASLKIYTKGANPPPTCTSTYKSKAGDTCTSIEAQFGLAPGQIHDANPFLNCQDIRTGINICIPPSTAPPPSCKSTYKSVAGDTCDTLDKKYNLVSGTIKQANQFLNCNDIWVGTSICVPDGPYNAPTCKSTYKSKAGDTCVTIDNMFNLVDGTTKQANSFLNCNDIWTGTPICLPDGP